MVFRMLTLALGLESVVGFTATAAVRPAVSRTTDAQMACGLLYSTTTGASLHLSTRSNRCMPSLQYRALCHSWRV